MSSESSPRVTYRDAEPGDLETLAPLKGKMKGAAMAAPEWVARWPWQFVEHPWRRPDVGANCVVALLDGRMAGAIGYMPTFLEVGDVEVPSAFGCELFVDPDAQGHGIGQRLIDEVVARYPYSLWMNTPPAGARSYEKRGFSGVEPVPFMAMPVGPGQLLRSRGYTGLGRALGWTGSIVRPITALRLRGFSPPDGIRLAEEQEFGPEFDRLREATHRADLTRPKRDAAYLTWRYLRCPFGPYQIGTARAGGELAGFVVYRVKPSPHGLMGVVNELEVDPKYMTAQRALLAAAVQSMLVAKPDLIVGLPSDPLTADPFRAMGFLDTRRTPYVYVAPGGAQQLGLPLDGARWSMSMGDCDVDYF